MVTHNSKKYPKRALRAQYSTHTWPSYEGLSTTLSLSRKVKNLTFPKGFVRMFATCSSVLMCWSLISPHCTISLIKWYLMLMYLEQSWNTRFSGRIIPLWLSQKITMVSSTCSNNSLKSFLNQTTSQQAILVAMYLALVVLKATDFHFLLIQHIEAGPKEKQHPDVLLGSTTLPTRSTSEYPCGLKFLVVYLSP